MNYNVKRGTVTRSSGGKATPTKSDEGVKCGYGKPAAHESANKVKGWSKESQGK